jgi:hypothetical protein
LRGNFEVDTSGYPVAAMPTGVNPGEFNVMEVTTMNKLLDNNVVPKHIAVQVAAYLNRGLRENLLKKDWNSLNEASKERYEAIKDSFDAQGNFIDQPAQQAQQVNSVSEGSAHPIQEQAAPETTADNTGVQAVESNDSTAAQPPDEDALLAETLAQPADAAAELAALIAEANGEAAPSPADTPAPVAPATQQVIAPAPIVIQPLTPIVK